MNRRNAIACMLTICLLSGCIVPRTKTVVPSFAGSIIDATSGLPLAGVEITDLSGTGEKIITSADGRFHFEAITDGIVWTFLAPGSGFPVSRTLIFNKDGFQENSCTCGNLSLFGQDNQATLVLHKGQSKPNENNPPLIAIQGSEQISCRPFRGSRVLHDDQPYRIEKIELAEGHDSATFSLVGEQGQHLAVTSPGSLLLSHGSQ